MSLLPEIKDGQLVEEVEPLRYVPPRFPKKTRYNKEEEELAALNNLNLDVCSEDFSDSPFLE